MPRGIRPPIEANRAGSFRKSTISRTSSLASSMPATSLNVTVRPSRSTVRTFSRLGMRPLMRNRTRPAMPNTVRPSTSVGIMSPRSLSTGVALNCTPRSIRPGRNVGFSAMKPGGAVVASRVPSRRSNVTASAFTRTARTALACTSRRKSENGTAVDSGAGRVRKVATAAMDRTAAIAPSTIQTRRMRGNFLRDTMTAPDAVSRARPDTHC